MRVTFIKDVEARCVRWEAARHKRVTARYTSALGRGDLPTDLGQLVVESRLGVRYGFWGCVAAGATFRSTAKKITRAGRAVIATHRRELIDADKNAHHHVDLWRAGQPTPFRAALDEIAALWRDLAPGGSIEMDWPSGHVVRSATRV